MVKCAPRFRLFYERMGVSMSKPAATDNQLIAGRNAVTEAIRSGRALEYLLVAKGTGGSARGIIALARQHGVPVKELPRKTLDEKLPGINHQGVAALCSAGSYADLQALIDRAKAAPGGGLLLVLDKIEDPHNLGAILRTAEASGASGVIIPKRGGVGLTATAVKVASGAAAYLPVARVSNLAAACDTLKENGFWLYGADMDGEDLRRVQMSGPVALVIGSEGFGISRLLKERCDFLIKIPMFGQINSLNASVAAGILLYKAALDRAAF